MSDLGFIKYSDGPVEGEELTDPGLWEEMKLAFKVENSLVSALAVESGNEFDREEGYNPYELKEDGSTDISGYEEWSESFVDSVSPSQTALVKNRIDNELQMRRDLAAGGTSAIVAQLAAGALDPAFLPFMFLPGGVVGRSAQLAKQTSKIRAAGSSFAVVGSQAAAGETVAEFVKHASQETRTFEESAFNIGGAALLGGVLGAGASALSRQQFDDVADTVQKALKDEEISVVTSNDPQFAGSVGAAAAQRLDLSMDDLELINTVGPTKEQARKIGLSEKGAARASSLDPAHWGISPIARLMSSPFIKSRNVILQMAEVPFFTKGNVDGVSTVPVGGAVQTRIDTWQAGHTEALSKYQEAFYKHRQKTGVGRGVRTSVNDFAGRFSSSQGNYLSRNEFSEQVAKALRRGDRHEIPEVQEAARAIRVHLDKMKNAAIDQGLLDPDVSPVGAESYFTRIYNVEKIRAKRGAADGLDTKLKNWFRGERTMADADSDFAKMEDWEIDNAVTEIINNITGVPGMRTGYDLPATVRGPLRERVLNVPDELIEDFLESDIESVLNRYTRTMSADIELTRAFGDVNMENLITEMNKTLDRMVEKARANGASDDDIKVLQKRHASDIRDIEGMRDLLRGTYAMPKDPDSFAVRVGKGVRDLNFLRLLGGMTISAIPDVGRIVARNGLGRTLGGGIKLIRNSSIFGKPLTKELREEVKRMAVGLDMVLNSRAMRMADVEDIYARGTKLERFLTDASDTFSKMTLMAPWNASLKQFSGVLSSDRLITFAGDYANLPKNHITRLANLGIDEDMARRISKQFKKHGDKGDLKLARIDKWDDIDAAETLKAAVLKDVDTTIVTPKAGDKPLWTSTEGGKLIAQFKSFALASHSKVFVADMQIRDRQAFNGMALMVGMGAVSYMLKEALAGREVSEDPNEIIANAIDRSGLLAIVGEGLTIGEQFTGGAVSLNSLAGVERPTSKFYGRNAVGALIGPSAGLVADVARGGSAAADVAYEGAQFSEGDINAMKRILPFQNLFYFRALNELVGE